MLKSLLLRMRKVRFPPIEINVDLDRHALDHQKARRSTLSVARNSLLLTTLAPYISWVLWLDADIIETPSSLIQDLTSHNRDIIVANAYQKYINENGQEQQRPYDFNSWIDSTIAQEMAANMEDDDVIFEGMDTPSEQLSDARLRGDFYVPCTYGTFI